MSRPATRILTGRPVEHTELVLGHRADGSPSVTLHTRGFGKRDALHFIDPYLVRALINDLEDAIFHLGGE